MPGSWREPARAGFAGAVATGLIGAVRASFAERVAALTRSSRPGSPDLSVTAFPASGPRDAAVVVIAADAGLMLDAPGVGAGSLRATVSLATGVTSGIDGGAEPAGA